MKKKFRICVVCGILCICTMFTVALADPGTDSDPLISKSYIDDVLMPKIEQYVESKIANLGSGNGGSQSGESFKVVNVSKGDKVICSAGTEVILRMGKASVIATAKGGLADTTAGFDLADGAAMPANHLLIVPLADGRGVKADTDIILMIKGGYSIK